MYCLPYDKIADEGLKYINNDMCCSCIYIAGQLISALKSGKYDINKVAFTIPQGYRGCRYINYVALVRKALIDKGWGNIPVMGFPTQLENHTGFKYDIKTAHSLLISLIYGDILMRCLYRIRPYELVPGSANALYEKSFSKFVNVIHNFSFRKHFQVMEEIVHEFDTLPLKQVRKPRVAVVGEVYVKFQPYVNHNIILEIEKEGAEAFIPDFYDVITVMQTIEDYDYKYLSGKFSEKVKYDIALYFLETYRKGMIDILKKSKRFGYSSGIKNLKKMTSKVLQLGMGTGSSWQITAEMTEVLNSGISNVVCLGPFSCLSSHLTGKGMIKKLKMLYPNSNIIGIDFDPGASEVNQLNRLKLLLSKAKPSPHPDE